jgi:hypothetical protein
MRATVAVRRFAGSMRPKGVSKRDRRFEVTGVPNLKAQSPPKR